MDTTCSIRCIHAYDDCRNGSTNRRMPVLKEWSRSIAFDVFEANQRLRDPPKKARYHQFYLDTMFDALVSFVWSRSFIFILMQVPRVRIWVHDLDVSFSTKFARGTPEARTSFDLLLACRMFSVLAILLCWCWRRMFYI